MTRTRTGLTGPGSGLVSRYGRWCSATENMRSSGQRPHRAIMAGAWTKATTGGAGLSGYFTGSLVDEGPPGLLSFKMVKNEYFSSFLVVG